MPTATVPPLAKAPRSIEPSQSGSSFATTLSSCAAPAPSIMGNDDHWIQACFKSSLQSFLRDPVMPHMHLAPVVQTPDNSVLPNGLKRNSDLSPERPRLRATSCFPRALNPVCRRTSQFVATNALVRVTARLLVMAMNVTAHCPMLKTRGCWGWIRWLRRPFACLWRYWPLVSSRRYMEGMEWELNMWIGRVCRISVDVMLLILEASVAGRGMGSFHWGRQWGTVNYIAKLQLLFVKSSHPTIHLDLRSVHARHGTLTPSIAERHHIRDDDDFPWLVKQR